MIRAVPGWEGMYSVTDQGEVISHSRAVACGAGRVRHTQEKLLKPSLIKDGKAITGLCVVLQRDKQRVAYSVSRLVLLAFVGPGPKDGVAHCKDRDSRNVRLENLEWTTLRAVALERGREPRERRVPKPPPGDEDEVNGD
jgi:hypothetical protein